jgi:hypothetical protein
MLPALRRRVLTCTLPALLRHFENRLSELPAALMMFGISVLIAASPAPSAIRRFMQVDVLFILKKREAPSEIKKIARRSAEAMSRSIAPRALARPVRG